MRRVIWALVAGFAALWAAWASAADEPSVGSGVALELLSSPTLELALPVSGVVDKPLVFAGQRVAKGELLLSLSQREFDLAVKAAKAKRDAAVPARDEAERELERAEELYERTVLSDHQLQLAKNDALAARARFDEAQAGLDRALLDRQRSHLHAPFDLRVLELLSWPGQVVLAKWQTRPLVLVERLDQRLAKARLSAGQAQGFVVGQVLQLAAWKARIVALEPLADGGVDLRVLLFAPKPEAELDGVSLFLPQ